MNAIYANEADIRAAYRLFLGREPDSGGICIRNETQSINKERQNHSHTEEFDKRCKRGLLMLRNNHYPDLLWSILIAHYGSRDIACSALNGALI